MINNFSKKLNEIAPFLFMLFILVQPVLDLLTSYSMLVLELNITPGIIIRFFIMCIGFLYILLNSIKDKTYKSLLYFISLAVFFVINLLVSYNVKPVFNLIDEITSIGKIVYFIMMTFIFYLIFNNTKLVTYNRKTYTVGYPNNVVVSQLIITIVMIISTLTNTAMRSYGALYKKGHSGWFFAANDLSAILAICFPILIWVFLKEDSIKRKICGAIILLGSIYSQFAIGTKVGYLAVVVSLITTFLAFVFKWGSSYFTDSIRPKIKDGLAISVIMGITILATPYAPAIQNTGFRLDQIMKVEEPPSDQVVDFENEKDDITGSHQKNNGAQISTVIYSGRDDFYKKNQEYYISADNIQKIVGMGYGGNYEEKVVIVERDFHDIFYRYGWLGTLLILLPFIYSGIHLLIIGLENINKLITYKVILSVTSILLGLGIAFIAGHVLFSPAVSTYLGVILAFLYAEVNNIVKKVNGEKYV